MTYLKRFEQFAFVSAYVAVIKVGFNVLAGTNVNTSIIGIYQG